MLSSAVTVLAAIPSLQSRRFDTKNCEHVMPIGLPACPICWLSFHSLLLYCSTSAHHVQHLTQCLQPINIANNGCTSDGLFARIMPPVKRLFPFSHSHVWPH